MVDRSDKDKDLEKIDIGNKLKTLIQTPIWRYVVSVFEKEQDLAFKKLIEGDDPDARATIRAIDRLYSRIDSSIKLSDSLMERYKEE